MGKEEITHDDCIRRIRTGFRSRQLMRSVVNKSTWKGGTKKRHAEKTGFTPVLDMILSGSAKLNTLCVSSAFGFVVELTVDARDSEYMRLNKKTFSRFDQPETDFVLKLCILTYFPNMPLDMFQTYRKHSMTHRVFWEEAVLQQKVWKQSICGGRRPLCPAVTNVVFMENEEATRFFTLLLQPSRLRTQQTAGAHGILHYLREQLIDNTHYQLGLLTMPKLQESVMLIDVLTSPSRSQETKIDCCVRACAHLLQLYLDVHVMHFDLHAGNILVTINDRGDVEDTLLIDFGQASDMSLETSDRYFRPEDKKTQCEFIAEKLKEFWNIHKEETDETKMNFIKDMLATLHFLDASKHNKKAQMSWIDPYDCDPEVYVSIFDTLFNQMSTLGLTLSSKQIQKWEREGSLFSFPPTGYLHASIPLSDAAELPPNPNPSLPPNPNPNPTPPLPTTVRPPQHPFLSYQTSSLKTVRRNTELKGGNKKKRWKSGVR